MEQRADSHAVLPAGMEQLADSTAVPPAGMEQKAGVASVDRSAAFPEECSVPA